MTPRVIETISSPSFQLGLSRRIGCEKCKRCIHCLYEAVVLENSTSKLGSGNAKHYLSSRNPPQSTKQTDSIGNTPLLTTPTHSQISTTNKVHLPIKVYGCSCEESIQPKPLISECYTCTRVLHRHIKLPSVLKDIDESSNTTAAITLAAAYLSRSLLERPEHQYLPLSENFVLDSPDEQYSIFAAEDGNLNIASISKYHKRQDND